MSNTLTLSLLVVLTALFSKTLASKCNTHDRKALIAIHNHFGKPPSLSATWQSPHVACCDWLGVGCYRNSNRVQNLDLIQLNLSGTIPPEIGDLPNLNSLTISKNPNVIGTIPPSITKLRKLLFLDLSRNSLSGPIPDYLSQVTPVTFLDLSYNRFSGSIPASIPKLNHLGAILLSHNQLTGTIPEFTGFGDGNIFLQHNKLSGPIPRSLAGLGWHLLDLSHNRLTGDASFLFGASTPATEIHLQGNKLSFDLTDVKFPLHLTDLELNNNYIYGSIPAQINQVTLYGLKKFNVSYNLLCGEIPQGVVTKSFGITSYFHNKCLCGHPLLACH